MKIGIWYLYNSYDSNWQSEVASGLSVALPRLQSWFGTSWNYEIKDEFHTSVVYDYALMPNKCFEAIKEMNAANPSFKAEYNSTELPVFVFGNSSEAFLVDYKSPIISSVDGRGLYNIEGRDGSPLFEHEFGHSLGCPDHMRPFAKPEYENCIYGNLSLDGIHLCPDCRTKYILSNYHKWSLSYITGVSGEPDVVIPQDPVEEPEVEPPVPQEPDPNVPSLGLGGNLYVYWAGLNTPQLASNSMVWPSDREIHCKFTIVSSDFSNHNAIVRVKFADKTSPVLTIAPGRSATTILTLSPLSVGQYHFSMILYERERIFGEEYMTVDVIPSEQPELPVYTYSRYSPKISPWVFISLGLGVSAIVLALLKRRR